MAQCTFSPRMRKGVLWMALLTMVHKADMLSSPSTASTPDKSLSPFKTTFNLGVLPKEFLERKIIYICYYRLNNEATCQEVKRCDDTMHLTREIRTGNPQKTLFVQECEGQEETVAWTEEDGLIKPDMLASLKAGQDFENPAFACTFFSQAEAPRKGEAPPTVLQLLFECTNPRDCSIAGSETNCASATPWTGTWAGNLKSGLKGNVTGTAVEDMQDEP